MCHHTIKLEKSMGICIYSCVPDRLSVWLLNMKKCERGVRMLDILKIALTLVLILFGSLCFSLDYRGCWVR